MKEKIVSFILILLIITVIIVIGIFGYTIYKEIMGDETLPIDFQGVRKSFWD
mgnify:CR=1 FL=1